MTTNTTTTLTQVIYAEEAEGANVAGAPAVALGQLLAGSSYAAVDNSGSTGGSRLSVAKAFVKALQVSLWNSTCPPPVPLRQVQWRSTGGTSPESVFV